MTISITRFNRNPANVGDLSAVAFAGFAHFTAMQVRNHRVRGLDLHLARLRDASDDLFGQHLPDSTMREHLRSALETAPADASLTCYVASRPGEFASAGERAALDVLVKVTEPAQPPTGPLALDLVEHERHLPHVKHVGEVSKTLLLRQANARGFDDAVFTDRFGRLSEATIWNLALWDGESVIWPRADMLQGITMRILSRGLKARGIPQQTREITGADLAEHMSAVVMNSWTPAVPISRIGQRPLALDPAFTQLLHECYSDQTPTRP
ncbi:aminotransferase class IV family protein [Natronoglycomyces albus]|uniref:Aminotransferase class IV family protein n=1 Tax=Natronoglycomyces albus TaxID=2811108 RepID=A0A895XPQ8_9ACTN|nr:aminotransferase class IV family protein [Natronoglycomyces albus]QSB04516.1 aminotransferase class IV family protein [Natronoglycomyces albus]